MTTTRYFWNPVTDNVIEEFDENGATTAAYLTEPTLHGNVLSQDRADSGVSQFHADPVGSIVLATDNAGAVTDTRLCDAFGEPIASTGSTVIPYHFVGRKGYYSDTGLGQIYVRERIYKDSMSRWLGADPLWRLGAGQVLTPRRAITKTRPAANLNRFLPFAGLSGYVYSNNNPLIYADPTGLVPCCAVAGEFRVKPLTDCVYIEDFLDGFYGQRFSIDIDFVDDPDRGLFCGCCEFRQYIRGIHRLRYVDRRGIAGPWGYRWPTIAYEYAQFWDSAVPPPTADYFTEDFDPLFPESAYGYRYGQVNIPDNMYSNPPGGVGVGDPIAERLRGCSYHMADFPGMPGLNADRAHVAAMGWQLEVEVRLEFIVYVLDFCTTDKDPVSGGPPVVRQAEFEIHCHHVDPAAIRMGR